MVERDRAIAAELSGPRRAGLLASRARLGITSEQVWLRQTPNGTFAVAVLKASDILAALARLATSQDPFDRWWRAEIEAIHGLDLSQPLPGPPNEQIMDFRIPSLASRRRAADARRSLVGIEMSGDPGQFAPGRSVPPDT